MAKHLVIVESPTKARTIRRFLPDEFVVEASMGHVRDLPQRKSQVPEALRNEPWADLGIDVDHGFRPIYVIPRGKARVIQQLRRALRGCDTLYLATDEDREGESISWHLVELLQPKVPVRRMVFDEITREAIQHALEHPRDIDERLVRAQETRRILDRLVGFTLSPLLWKKIAYGLSAGRVQSAGLRLIVERERERMAFRSAEYWDVKATAASGGQEFEARLVAVSGRRVATGKDFDETTGELRADRDVAVLDEARAREVAEAVRNVEWRVESVEEKTSRLRPAPPFTTSTLQQEANRRLGLSARDTMRVAQSLYERGLITYMRTDSPALSSEAIAGARSAVESLYGKEYLSDKPRQYRARSRTAQEAHEAIRPAGARFRHPSETGLSGRDLRLYTLIWRRTVATQMAEAVRKSLAVRIAAGEHTFAANGNVIVFPGFLRAMVEGAESPDEALGERERILPPLAEGDVVEPRALEPERHETRPPARYTEATLVRRLDEAGIGRPSTYAMIIGTLLDRDYVRKVGNALVPTFTGFAVVQLLERHFTELVDYEFTSQMEERLDEIARGEREWLPYLESFYNAPGGLRERIEKKLEEIDPEASRTIEDVRTDGIRIRVGRFGPYAVRRNGEEVRASIPEDIAPADVTPELLDELIERAANGPESLGVDPETGKHVYCLVGRYGPYVQLGEATDDEPKPRRASVPRDIDYRSITLEQALRLLSLPRVLGTHPETGEPVEANNGRFGPYVVHQGDFRSLRKGDDVYTITLERALEILAEPKRGRGGSKRIRELGVHPDTGRRIDVYEGRYGPFLKYGSKNVGLPEGVDPAAVTLEQAVEIVNAKAPARGRRATKKGASKARTRAKTGSRAKTKAKTKAKTGTKAKAKAKAKTKAKAGTRSKRGTKAKRGAGARTGG